jgi:hypothetical protein
MHRAMMPAAEWDREFIADFAAERTGLGKSEVMGIRGLAPAHETSLLGDIAKVFSVAIATRRSNREDALVDALPPIGVDFFGRDRLQQPSNLRVPSDDGSADSLRSKASSTSLASLAIRLFLATSA